MFFKILQVFFISSIVLLSPILSFGQAQDKSVEFGVELGGGHNQFFMQSESPAMHDRTKFSLMPSVRINVNIPSSTDFSIYSFVGYNEFGGKDNGEYPAGGVKFNSEVKIQALEFGLLGLFNVSNFRIGLGTKYNHHLNISDRYEYFRGTHSSWDPRQYSSFMNNWSLDGGFRVEYELLPQFTFGTEGWFGLTDIANNDAENAGMEFRQNHFRLLIGYRF